MARALIIVDFQNQFTPGGALPVPDGDQISERINQLAASGEFHLVVATRDWHPPDHGSFVTKGGPWPRHCVAGSEGAQLHSALDQRRIDVVIDKGQDPDTEGYSGFAASRHPSASVHASCLKGRVRRPAFEHICAGVDPLLWDAGCTSFAK